jgi:hypothetical protein
VNENHFIIAKKFEDEVNSPLKGEVETTYQKNSNPYESAIVNFFATKDPFHIDRMHRNLFLMI